MGMRFLSLLRGQLGLGGGGPSRALSSATPSPSAGEGRSTSTMDNEEVRHFEEMANSWWDLHGPLKELHFMNRLRVPLIRDGLLESKGPKASQSPKPLEGLRIMDVGCGGGILTEPLARLGASVVGLDPGRENISVAEVHLRRSPDIEGKVEYLCSTIEDFVRTNPQEQFDGIVSSEVVEHVEKVDVFLGNIAQCVKPGGSLFLTTPNRTLESWFTHIFAWEYLLKRLPVGTHQWNKFVTPSEVQLLLNDAGLRVKLVHGMCYNPVTERFSWSSSTALQYCIHAIKES